MMKKLNFQQKVTILRWVDADVEVGLLESYWRFVESQTQCGRLSP